MNSDRSQCKMAKLLTLKVIFSLVLLVLIILIITHSEKISIKQDALEKFITEGLEQRTCSELCNPGFIYQQEELCCKEEELKNCEKKHICKQRLVEKDLEIIAQLYTIFYCQSGFSGLVFLIIVIVLYKLIQGLKKRMRLQNTLFGENIEDSNLSDRLIKESKNQSILSNSFILDDNQNVCVVCLNHFQNQMTIKLVCNHYFHHACIEKWIEHHQTCPTCRAIL